MAEEETTEEKKQKRLRDSEPVASSVLCFAGGHGTTCRVESSLYAKKMAGPIGHRREKEMKREQIAKYIHEI